MSPVSRQYARAPPLSANRPQQRRRCRNIAIDLPRHRQPPGFPSRMVSGGSIAEAAARCESKAANAAISRNFINYMAKC
jgi:hypothetical protein